ncbi:hypothetical protein PoB_005451300 [Plakobranchus ocellatus]|uniref:Uncharacterized protein n=1 Tax=Plakobranchus ocellatus TaxID=259542 RepID=A0AAV4C922_9GAST|nr:hypothetical protein PoB_005451300 [Plakobranchus ocellatus]
MKLSSGLAASPVPRFLSPQSNGLFNNTYGPCPSEGKLWVGGACRGAACLKSNEAGVTRPTILEESQCASSSLPRLFLFLHRQVFPLAPQHCTAVVPVLGERNGTAKRQSVNFSGHGSRHHHQKTLTSVF